jgi:predicted aspartyl protease
MLRIKQSIHQCGVIVTLRVSLSLPREIAMRSKHRPVPKPVEAKALIDTGADCTLIDGSIALSLGLVPTGQCELRSLDNSSNPEFLPVYDVDLAFVAETGVSTRFTSKVASKTLGNLPYMILLGRYIFQYCTLVYSGVENQITLTI